MTTPTLTPGKALVLVGPQGSGKTVLARKLLPTARVYTGLFGLGIVLDYALSEVILDLDPWGDLDSMLLKPALERNVRVIICTTEEPPEGFECDVYRMPPAWAQRLQVERDELAERKGKLEQFIDSDQCVTLGSDDRDLLQRQRDAQAALLSILDERLARVAP